MMYRPPPLRVMPGAGADSPSMVRKGPLVSMPSVK